jgi:hypothetical protein
MIFPTHQNEEPLKIEQMSIGTSATLSLQGTVLTYISHNWISETIIEIPVELISICERKQHKYKHLLLALLWMAVSALISYHLLALPQTHDLIATPAMQKSLLILSAIITTLPALLMLARFIIPRRAIHLIFADPDSAISFWSKKGEEKKENYLIGQIIDRQKYVQDRVAFPMNKSIRNTTDLPGRKLIRNIWLLSIPALLTGLYPLLLLPLIPLACYLWNILYLSEQPRLFRKALNAYLQKHWSEALGFSEELALAYQDYLPGKMLRIQLFLQLHRFEDAIRQLQAAEREVDADLAERIQQEIILRKRIFERQHPDD